MMQARNDAFSEKFGLAQQPYRWDLEQGQLAFLMGDHVVVADLCVVGSASGSEGTFRWSWANEAIGGQAKARIDEVRAFGEKHDLGLLTTAQWRGGRPEGIEMLAIAGRVLDADGVWIDAWGDATVFFTLHRFRTCRSSDLGWLAEATPP